MSESVKLSPREPVHSSWGFVKGGAPSTLTGCEDEFASGLTI